MAWLAHGCVVQVVSTANAMPAICEHYFISDAEDSSERRMQPVGPVRAELCTFVWNMHIPHVDEGYTEPKCKHMVAAMQAATRYTYMVP